MGDGIHSPAVPRHENQRLTMEMKSERPSFQSILFLSEIRSSRDKEHPR